MNKLLNEKMRDNDPAAVSKLQNLIVTGADTVALYPSLDQEITSEVIKEEFLSSDIEPEGINYKEALRYIAMVYSKEQIQQENLERVVPKTRFN